MLVIVLFWIGLYVWQLGASDIYYEIEALRALVARDMLQTGNWLVPYYRGSPYLAKPPLMNWLIAIASLPTGVVSEWSSRLPSSIAVLAGAAGLYAWLRRYGRGEIGRYAALLYMALPLVFEKGTRAEIEIVLTTCIAASLILLFEGTERAAAGERAVSRIAGAYTCLALAVLAKGPPALLFFVATWMCYQTVRGWRYTPWRAHLLGIVLCVVLVSAWLLPLISAVGWDWFVHVFQVEAVQRLTDASIENKGPVYFYPISLFVGALPACLLLPFVRVSGLPAAERRIVWFLICWIVSPLLLLSLADAKESRYLLPVYPAAAVLGAYGLERVRATLRHRSLPGAAARIVIIVALLAVAPLFILLHSRVYPLHLHWGVLWAVLWVAAAAILVLAWRGQHRSTAAAVGLGLIVLLKAAYATSVIPDRNARRSLRPVSEQINAIVPPGETLTMVGLRVPQFDYYLDMPVRYADDLRSGSLDGGSGRDHYLLYPEHSHSADEVASLRNRMSNIDETLIVGTTQNYVLLHARQRD